MTRKATAVHEPPAVEPGVIASSGPGPAPKRRNRGRRILWFRWYGFPSDARWHLAQIGKHLRSLLGLRP